MPASWRPLDLVLFPNGLTHCFRHDGIVVGGKGESWASKPRSRIPHIPVHQPAEAFIELLDIERIGPGKGFGAATAPEGLKGLVGIAAKATAHAGDFVGSE